MRHLANAANTVMRTFLISVTLHSKQQQQQQQHSFNGLFSRTTERHQKGKTILDFNEARDDGVAVASVGPYSNHLHFASNRKPHQHFITQLLRASRCS